MRRTRSSIFGPYPKAFRHRRCNCRSLNPTLLAKSSTPARPRSIPLRTLRSTWVINLSGGSSAKLTAASSNASAGSAADLTRSSNLRLRAGDHRSRSSTRSFNSSRAGTPRKPGAVPGANRIPAYLVPASADPVHARLSGPATISSLSVSSRSIQPSGRIRYSPPSAVRVHSTAPGTRVRRSRYGSTTKLTPPVCSPPPTISPRNHWVARPLVPRRASTPASRRRARRCTAYGVRHDERIPDAVATRRTRGPAPRHPPGHR